MIMHVQLIFRLVILISKRSKCMHIYTLVWVPQRVSTTAISDKRRRERERKCTSSSAFALHSSLFLGVRARMAVARCLLTTLVSLLSLSFLIPLFLCCSLIISHSRSHRFTLCMRRGGLVKVYDNCLMSGVSIFTLSP